MWLVDTDFSLGNLNVVMDINNKYNISHMLNGVKKIEDIIHFGPNGLEIICGASGLQDLADLTEFQRNRLLTALSKLQDDTDTMIIDTAAGISKSVVGFCLAADHVLVVTTPEATAMTDAYAMIKVLTGNKYPGRISLVVNMVQSAEEGRKTYQQIASVAKRFLNAALYYAGCLAQDSQLAASVRLRKPVVLAYPKAKITSSLAALAVKLGSCNTAQPETEGFFRKVVDWFF